MLVENPKRVMPFRPSSPSAVVAWNCATRTPVPVGDVQWGRPVFHAPALVVPDPVAGPEPFARQHFLAPPRRMSVATSACASGEAVSEASVVVSFVRVNGRLTADPFPNPSRITRFLGALANAAGF